MPEEFLMNEKTLRNNRHNRNPLRCSNQDCGEVLNLGDLVIKVRSNTHGRTSRTKYYHEGCFYTEPKRDND